MHGYFQLWIYTRRHFFNEPLCLGFAIAVGMTAAFAIGCPIAPGTRKFPIRHRFQAPISVMADCVEPAC